MHCGSTLILSQNLLHLLRRYHGVGTDPRACLHMLKEGLVPLSLTAARTSELQQFKYLAHVVMHLDWPHATAAISLCAGPAALHPDATFAEEAVACGAFKWVRLHNELT